MLADQTVTGIVPNVTFTLPASGLPDADGMQGGGLGAVAGGDFLRHDAHAP